MPKPLQKGRSKKSNITSWNQCRYCFPSFPATKTLNKNKQQLLKPLSLIICSLVYLAVLCLGWVTSLEGKAGNPPTGPRPNFQGLCSGSSNMHNFQTQYYPLRHYILVNCNDSPNWPETYDSLDWSMFHYETTWTEVRWGHPLSLCYCTSYFTQRRHGLLKLQPSCCTTKPTMKALSIVIKETNEDILQEK